MVDIESPKTGFGRFPLYLAAAFATLWVIAIGWEFSAVRDLDWRIAKFLNGTIGRSETWDLTIFFLSLDPGDILGGLLAGVVVFKLIRESPRAGLARYLVFGATVLMLASAADEFADTLDDYVWRSSPAFDIAGFRDPGFVLGVPNVLPDKARFPSDRAVTYTMIFFLCLYRFGRKALPLLALPLMSGIVHVAAGKFWPTDILGGMVLGWAIAAGLYALRLNELLNWCERQLEAYLYDPAGRMLRRSIAGTPAAPRAVADPETAVGPEGMAEFVRREWPIDVAAFDGIAHKRKVFSFVADGRRVVLKKSRFGGERREALGEALGRVRDLRERGVLPCPAILPARDGALVVADGDAAWYMTEWVDGRPVDFADLDAVGKVVERLAVLHEATAVAESDDPVALVARAVEEQVTYYERRLARAAVLGRDPLGMFLPPNAEHRDAGSLAAEGARSRFVAQQAVVYALRDRSERVRCLVHGDTHPMNCLIDDSGAVHLLDLDWLGIGYAFSDLEVPLAKLMRRTGWDADVFDRVLARYATVRPIGRWELALLVAALLFPRALREIPRRSRLRSRSVRRLTRMRLVRAEIEAVFEARKREDFLVAVARRHDIPLIAGLPDSREPTPIPEEDERPVFRA